MLFLAFQGLDSFWERDGETSIKASSAVTGNAAGKTYLFDRTFGPNHDNVFVYQHLAKDIIESAMKGRTDILFFHIFVIL